METIYTTRENLKYTLEHLYEACANNDAFFTVNPKSNSAIVYKKEDSVFIHVVDIQDETDLTDMIFGKEGK